VAAKVAVTAEERFLYGIRRRVTIADDAHDESEEVILVDGDDVVEGIEVARERTLHENSVAGMLQLVTRPALARLRDDCWLGLLASGFC
jgi:hypothetical protein